MREHVIGIVSICSRWNRKNERHRATFYRDTNREYILIITFIIKISHKTMLDKFSLFFKYKNCTQINLCVKSSYLKNSPKSCGSAWTAKEKRNKTNEIHTTQKYIQNSVKETWTSVNPSSTRSPRPQPRPLDLCYREQRSIPLRRRQRLRKQLILIRVYSSIKSRRGSRESGRVSFGAHDYPAALVTPR